MSVSFRPLAAILVAILLTGCATDNTKPIEAQAPKKKEHNDARTKEMKKWLGNNVEKLMAEKGTPAQTIDATLLGRPPAEAYIYPAKDDSGCYDAFVVQENNGLITDYFCR
ncbi:MAG: hypothetical protein G8345_14645 [Magnetococcales bacterium]|nr:hypothetical protein [Magnetococcales bacterium]NGZ28115.1 hypothetical protein [Magnetococcales bacterium]